MCQESIPCRWYKSLMATLHIALQTISGHIIGYTRLLDYISNKILVIQRCRYNFLQFGRRSGQVYCLLKKITKVVVVSACLFQINSQFTENLEEFWTWYASHSSSCTGAMEKDIERRILSNYLDYSLRYKYMVCDGANKAFNNVWDVYGCCDDCNKWERMDKKSNVIRNGLTLFPWEKEIRPWTWSCKLSKSDETWQCWSCPEKSRDSYSWISKKKRM